MFVNLVPVLFAIVWIFGVNIFNVLAFVGIPEDEVPEFYPFPTRVCSLLVECKISNVALFADLFFWVVYFFLCFTLLKNKRYELVASLFVILAMLPIVYFLANKITFGRSRPGPTL